MSRLIHRLRSRGAERGAVAALVAIVLGSGVLFGMGALVIDVGGMYSERAQLQNGADAGALAVALGCGSGVSTCSASTSSTGLAGKYASHNANDGTANVDKVCGQFPLDPLHLILPACVPSAPGCAATPVSGTNYAQVQTSTLNGGSTLLPPTFSQTLLGPSYQGKTVHACAQAAWGSPASLDDTLALTLSLCEWNIATANNTVFAKGPPYPTWPPAYTGTVPQPGVPGAEQVLQLHGSGNSCAGSNAAGWDLPGGFGWLADAAGNCSVHIDINGIYNDDTGASAGKNCKTALTDAQQNRTVLYLPVFDGEGGTGHNGTYHLKGFAAFVVTGYSLPGLSAKSAISNKDYCKGTTKCVYGFFTQGLVAKPGQIGGSDLGARIVQMIG
jgi:hypothetical protein